VRPSSHKEKYQKFDVAITATFKVCLGMYRIINDIVLIINLKLRFLFAKKPKKTMIKKRITITPVINIMTHYEQKILLTT
jgi:hypothetical protein